MDLWNRGMNIPLRETRAGTISAIVLSLVSMAVLAVCLSRRVQNIQNWRAVPFVNGLVLAIYIDSIAFVAGTAILSNGYGIASSALMCSRAILLCLGCYMTTKASGMCCCWGARGFADMTLKLLYYFLVERVYVVRRNAKPRMKDPLYLFNSFGMLLPYLVVITLNFYFRFSIWEDGTCQIGMKRVAMIPLIAFDVFVNVYLTSLFLLPLRATWSYRNNRTSSIRVIALRTFIGSCATLVSSVVNLTFVTALNGEPGWVCLMCCNSDILFSVLVLHWITSRDKTSKLESSNNNNKAKTPSIPAGRSRVRASPSDVMEYQSQMKDRKARGFVMTMVSAAHEEEMFDKITFPENAITVERSHTVEISELEHGSCRRSECDASGKRSNKSTEELFCK